jgi:anti-anti-sigma factor
MSMRVPDHDTDAGPMLGSASLLTSGSFTTLVLSGEFDAGTSSGLLDALRVASADRRDLVVDMTGVTFLDGFALRHIEQASRALAAAGSTLRIAHAPRVVARLLQAAGATGLLHA